MMKEYDRYARPTALVIGAGLGGIAAAARMVQAGFHVRVVEKNGAPGGTSPVSRCADGVFDDEKREFLHSSYQVAFKRESSQLVYAS
jgi:cation diffusion facilitator CzcD-associated flavoprotein CzcO